MGWGGVGVWCGGGVDWSGRGCAWDGGCCWAEAGGRGQVVRRVAQGRRGSVWSSIDSHSCRTRTRRWRMGALTRGRGGARRRRPRSVLRAGGARYTIAWPRHGGTAPKQPEGLKFSDGTSRTRCPARTRPDPAQPPRSPGHLHDAQHELARIVARRRHCDPRIVITTDRCSWGQEVPVPSSLALGGSEQTNTLGATRTLIRWIAIASPPATNRSCPHTAPAAALHTCRRATPEPGDCRAP